VHFKGKYLLWFGIGLAMSFVLARYLGLEIDWNLVTGAPFGVLSAARKYA
jgi:membrane protein implicated in regulation of membrane protease activity